MFRELVGGITLASVLAFGYPVGVHAEPAPSVVLNELLWMGSSASSADEWIELRNLSADPVDLSGWQLTRRSSGAEVLMLTIPSGKSVPANGYFLIANNAPTALFGTAPNQQGSPLAAAPDVVDASVSLLNSGLQLKLYAGPWSAGGALVDTADDGTGNPLAGAFDSSTGTYVSMERNLVPGDGAAAASWHTATRGAGWDAGAVELGTPGSANSASTPTAALAAPANGTVGQALAFDASESSDPEGRMLAFAWTFGDGATTEGATATHAFGAPGDYSVLLTVSNGERSASASGSVTVSEAAATPAPNPPPVMGDLVLSELQPSPSADEFVEVRNRGSVAADLSGWVLADGARRYVVASGSVPAGGLRAFPVAATGIHWNDEGDTAYLYAPDGRLVDAVRYARSRAGWSLVRLDAGWAWSDRPTPGSANAALGTVPDVAVAVAPELPGDGAVRGASTQARSVPAPASVALGAVNGLERGTVVRVRGTVTAVPGTVAVRTVYITDGNSGLAVYAATATLPKLVPGDSVEVTGRVSHVQRGDRLLVSRTADVRVVQHGSSPMPRAVSANELDAETVGMLVSVTAPLVDLTSTRITLDDGSGEVVVRRPKGFRGKVGDTVTAVGILIGGDVPILYPRGAEDVRVGEGSVAGAQAANPLVPAAQAATPGSTVRVDAPEGDPTGTALLLFGGAVTLGALVLVALKRFAPHLWNPRRERR